MNKLKQVLATMLLMAFSASTLAIPLSDVGGMDDFLSSDTLGSSGDATEKAWIESVLGFSISYSKVASSGGSAWEAVDGGVAGDYAFDFGVGVDPAYFLVKVGGGRGTGTEDTHFLYENLADLRWGFVNLEEFGDAVKLDNIGVISHVAIADGGTSVPEPSILALLGIGLVGLGLARSRKTS